MTSRHEADSEIRHIAETARDKVQHMRATRGEEVAASRTGQNLARIPYLRGNEVELLVDGDATFGSILEGIAVEMRPEHHNKSFWFKLGVRLARLTAPVQ